MGPGKNSQNGSNLNEEGLKANGKLSMEETERVERNEESYSFLLACFVLKHDAGMVKDLSYWKPGMYDLILCVVVY